MDENSLNILHIITTIELGGAEKQLLVLTEKQIQAGNKVTVLFLKGKPELKTSFETSGVRVLDTIANKPFLLQIRALRTNILRGFDLIHAHLPRSEMLVFFSRNKIPWLISRHNAEPFFPYFSSLLSPLISRLITRNTAAIIAISNAVRQFLIESNEIKDNSKIFVIPYGFHEQNEEIKPSKRKPLEKRNSFRIVTVSRLVAQKDLKTLLKATRILKSLDHKIEVFIYGNGPLKAELVDFAHKLEIADCVFFPGKSSDIKSALGDGDIFVLTSKYEGFGLALLEAIQSNLPIVCCKNAATEEVLGSEYEGLVPIGQSDTLALKIIEFLKPEFHQRALDYLQKRLSLYDPQVMADKVLEIYRKII